jgi:hypothetical protein
MRDGSSTKRLHASCLDIHNLFRTIGRQNFVVVFANSYFIFDSNADASKVLWPLRVKGHTDGTGERVAYEPMMDVLDTWFNGDDHALLQSNSQVSQDLLEELERTHAAVRSNEGVSCRSMPRGCEMK